MGSIAYWHSGRLYLNLTSRCPTACTFCIKHEWDWAFHGADLRLAKEPGVSDAWTDVSRELSRREPPQEAVFCGYGEPTLRYLEVIELGRLLRRQLPWIGLRLNTIGLGNMIWDSDIVPQLAATVDSVRVSLNAPDAASWRALHRPQPRFAEGGFEGVLDFIRRCVRSGLRTTVTAVALPGVDMTAVAAVAAKTGAGFMVRPVLDD